MPRENWILLAIASAPGGALQPAQVQSCLYLLAKNLTAEQLESTDFYHFEAHEYGTFTLPIHLDLERLVESGLLDLRHHLWPAREYAVTAAGREAVRSHMRAIPASIVGYMEGAVAWITSFTVQELIGVDLNAAPPPPPDQLP